MGKENEKEMKLIRIIWRIQVYKNDIEIRKRNNIDLRVG